MEDHIVTIEISMYPLVNEYEPHIISFLQNLKSYDGILVKTNAMSTYVQGPFETVWKVLGETFKNSFKSGIPLSNVMKIIPRKLPLEDLWLEF